jgi:protein tyrosine/serine phosphatase
MIKQSQIRIDVRPSLTNSELTHDKKIDVVICNKKPKPNVNMIETNDHSINSGNIANPNNVIGILSSMYNDDDDL